MELKNYYTLLFITVCFTINAQTNILKINPDIVLPRDSLDSKILLFSVNEFLSAAQNNNENKWILPAESIETRLLTDEIIAIQKNEELENDSFFKAYLTNITPLENNKYAVCISYIGVNKDSVKLRANFELIAHKTNDVYLISSPLVRKTKNWKTKKIQNQIFHYPDTLNSIKVQRFYNLTSLFDEKLNNNDRVTHYYLCGNETSPLKLFGVEYKSDYNGERLDGRWQTSIDKKDLFVMTTSKFNNYPEHDYWHFRMSQVISRREVHRRVDCHIATLYGGLWGISWKELFAIFTEKYVIGSNVDWLEHRKNKTHFLTTKRKRKNYTDDFIGALIIKKIEKDKGFDGVWELLMTKRTKNEKEYFDVLEELIGISKENYNKEVSKLIKEEIAGR